MKTRQTLYINARKPSERVVCLKPHSKLVAEAAANPESTEKYEKNYLDDWYPIRPEAMENVCYYEFRRSYEKTNNPTPEMRFRNSDLGMRQKPGDPFLISFPVFKKPEEKEKYQYALLLLFKPFRKEIEELLDQDGNCENIFQSELQTNKLMADYHNRLQAQFTELAAQNQELKDMQAQPITQSSTCTDIPVIMETEEPLVNDAITEIMEAMAGNVAEKTENSLQLMVDSMNQDQFRVYSRITMAMSENSIVKMFVSGSGGTGMLLILCYW